MFRATCANPDVRVAVNDPFIPLDYMVNQHQYDSVHGRSNGTIAMSEEELVAILCSTSESRNHPSDDWPSIGLRTCRVNGTR